MSNLIKDREAAAGAKKEYVNKIKDNINVEELKKVFADKYNLDINDIEFKHGDIVSQNGKVTFKLDYEAMTTLSLRIDDEGNIVESPEEKIEEAGQQAQQAAQVWGQNS